MIYDGVLIHAENDDIQCTCKRINMMKNGEYDIIVMRHYLEHYWNPRKF